MTVFAKLCLRARAKGAGRLIFTVDVTDDDEEAGMVGRWTCVGGDPKGENDAVGVAYGVTGEQALRNLVEQLEAGK